MPRGPRGEKPPGDEIGNDAKVMRLATGGETEEAEIRRAAAELGSLGGKARAANLSKKKRAEIAKKAAAARWNRS